jgi:hypothetical protein
MFLLLHTQPRVTHLGASCTAIMQLLLATCCCYLLAVCPPGTEACCMFCTAVCNTTCHTPWHQLDCHHAVTLLICAHPYIAFCALQHAQPAATHQHSRRWHAEYAEHLDKPIGCHAAVGSTHNIATVAAWYWASRGALQYDCWRPSALLHAR